MERLTEQAVRMKLAKAGLELEKEWIDGRLYHVRVSPLISSYNSFIASFKSLRALDAWFDERFKDKETMLRLIDETDIDEITIRQIQSKTHASRDEVIERIKMLKKVIVREKGIFPYGMSIVWSYEHRLILGLIPRYSPDFIRRCLQEVGISEWFDEVITI